MNIVDNIEVIDVFTISLNGGFVFPSLLLLD
jgi:hypothetical protein